jgi:hypothetical protein
MSHLKARQRLAKLLNLDDRPVVMLAANVLGDSLTLGRDIFAASMTEWITKTVQYFAKRTDVQMVIRVHPGEKLVPQAKSMGTVVREALPELPSHIHVIGALDKINTYDLIEIADVGLAYTTTVGLRNRHERTPRHLLRTNPLSRARHHDRPEYVGRILRHPRKSFGRYSCPSNE